MIPLNLQACTGAPLEEAINHATLAFLIVRENALQNAYNTEK